MSRKFFALGGFAIAAMLLLGAVVSSPPEPIPLEPTAAMAAETAEYGLLGALMGEAVISQVTAVIAVGLTAIAVAGALASSPLGRVPLAVDRVPRFPLFSRRRIFGPGRSPA